MPKSRKQYLEHYKLGLDNARLTVWIKFKAKDQLDASKRFNEMSDRTLLRLINEGQATIRVLDTEYACVLDSEVL
jgi:hypothetical protein